MADDSEASSAVDTSAVGISGESPAPGPALRPVLTRAQAREGRRFDLDVDLGSSKEVTELMRKELLKLSSHNRADGKVAAAGTQWNLPTAGLDERKPAAFTNDAPVVTTAAVLPVNAAEPSYVPSRHIVEGQSMQDLIANYTRCTRCEQYGTMQLSFTSSGVASVPELSCQSKRCMNLQPDLASIQRTNLVPFDAVVRQRNISYETNVRYVLSLIASGDGSTEAQRIAGMLNLPNISSMGSTTFLAVEKAISPSIHLIGKEALFENLTREVELNMKGDSGFNLATWVRCVKNKQPLPDTCKRPTIKCVSMDMGWQKRASGLLYDSSSGHSNLCGGETRLAICSSLRVKHCAVCNWHYSNGGVGEPRPHQCTINHQGTSGAMEAASLIDMIVVLDGQLVILERIITDDDSTMKAAAKWTNADYCLHHRLVTDPKKIILGGYHDKKKPHCLKPRYRTDGSLPYPIKEPVFYADPAHRKKTLRNRLYKIMLSGAKNNSGLQEGDIVRITLSFAYLTKQLVTTPHALWKSRASAVLEHHFDCHDHCGDYCKRKDTTEDDRAQSDKMYRCKVRDKHLYAMLKKVLSDFISEKRLEEVGHGGDTNVNESLNNTISWLAPKNKTYCGTTSLSNRIMIAIGIHILGFDEFYRRLFEALGMTIDPAFLYYVGQQQQQRARRILKSGLIEKKRFRQSKTYAKLKEYHAKVQSERKKGLLYQPGIGMRRDPTLPPKEKTSRGTRVVVKPPNQPDGVKDDNYCRSCMSWGHKRSTSKLCPNNKKRKATAITVAATTAEYDQEEQSLLDSIPMEAHNVQHLLLDDDEEGILMENVI